MRPRRGRLAFTWALLATAAAPGLLRDSGAAEPAARTAAAADVQDMIFLGPMRPLVWQVHITIDGKPFRARWQERFDSQFAALDENRDGRLSVTEATALLREMNGSLRDLAESTAPDTAGLQGLADSAGQIDKQSLAIFVTEKLPVLVVRSRAAVGRGSSLALFPLLDTDGNHQLSAAELAAAATQLRQRDFDDDGVITGPELILDPKALAAAADPNADAREIATGEAAILLVDRGTPPEQIAARLLAHYDRDRDGRLSLRSGAREIKLAPALERRMDANRDGALDEQELRGFTLETADLELYFAFGRVSAADSRAKPRAADSSLRVRRTLVGGYDLKLGEAVVALKRNNADPQEGDPGRFNALDRDNNNYLDANEASMGNLGAAAFKAMDADGNEMVVRAEFASFMERQDEAAAARLILEVTDLGQNLFDLLDADQDGVLSARELKNAPQILDANDLNGDGVLNGDEIPQSFEMELARGVDPKPEPTTILGMGTRSARSATAAATVGPLWFRKMDRNNDGDVDRREFLGPREAFEKLDANRDGLIDRDEAEAGP